MRDLFVGYSEAALLGPTEGRVQRDAFDGEGKRGSAAGSCDVRQAEGEAFLYIHEFLSQILSANRNSVRLAAQSKRTAGLINYRRGKIQAFDRLGLERIVRMVRDLESAFRRLPHSDVHRDPEPQQSRRD
ncbi:hypothetical protein [Bradyrhizobium sp. CCBAU 11434]|uniref:hypothetical protein n=1 Tax=Bradyrhizobium sp. CCBAU 11434 TaxID=1630885 RepID=UPI00230656D9|nr:hypothetical protein [Bradyrhizobium sp. CCBAU 11434]